MSLREESKRKCQRCPTKRALDAGDSVAFSSSLCGLKLIPAKQRYLVPPTRG